MQQADGRKLMDAPADSVDIFHLFIVAEKHGKRIGDGSIALRINKMCQARCVGRIADKTQTAVLIEKDAVIDNDSVFTAKGFQTGNQLLVYCFQCFRVRKIHIELIENII